MMMNSFLEDSRLNIANERDRSIDFLRFIGIALILLAHNQGVTPPSI